MAILEACVETVDEARAVEQGGASRIELCANLAEQGTTPDEAAIAACVAAVRIPVFVMVRPRAGNFVYANEELSVLLVFTFDITNQRRELFRSLAQVPERVFPVVGHGAILSTQVGCSTL